LFQTTYFTDAQSSGINECKKNAVFLPFWRSDELFNFSCAKHSGQRLNSLNGRQANGSIFSANQAKSESKTIDGMFKIRIRRRLRISEQQQVLIDVSIRKCSWAALKIERQFS
ncbi:hypothetical protein, partial [Winogradskyella sp.]